MSQTPTSTPDPSWKGLPSWLIFSLLVIGPPSALIAFTHTLTQNPLLIASLILGYEVVLFILRFTGKIWQQLEDALVKFIAQWLTAWVKERTGHYYKFYCEHLVYENQVLDVKGLSTRTAHDLELEQVFVDLRVDPLPAHQASADPLHEHIPESLQGTHSIWDYLSTSSLSNPHLVILGAPGSGKTTLLKHLALTLAQPKKYSRKMKQHTFPILLFLRDYTRTIVEQADFSLAQAVQDHVQHTWQKVLPLSWIEHHLQRGTCLVLLDGLDEVADATTRRQVVAWIQRQMIAYPHNRFVLTSRPYGYRENPLEGVTVLDVQPFTSQQIEQFIQNWYLANELKSWGKDDPGVQLRAQEGTRDLLRRLRQVPALFALAVNPLLLTMIATVHRYRSSLPGKRVDLYKEICEVFLGKRQEARGIAQDLSPAQKQQVLQPLAYFLMRQGIREIISADAQREVASALALVNSQMTPADFLQQIENTSGLLLERNPGIYGFAHKTFQEYLAAVHIKEVGLEHVLKEKVTDDWWHETIRLYCAQADATNLILACLEGHPPATDALVLAFDCDDEKLKIQPIAQSQLNQILVTGGEDPDPERQRVIREALLTRRLHRMAHVHDETYIDTTLVTCEEYQLFLDEQRVQGKYYQPDHWTSFSFAPGAGKTPLLGMRRSDAQTFCGWLSRRDKEGWHYRLPHMEEAEQLSERIERQNTLSAETGYWSEEAPIFMWSQQKPPDALQRIFIEIVDCAINYVLDRAGTGRIDRARARDLSRVFARALDRTLTRTRIIDLDLALTLDLARASTVEHAMDQVHSPIRLRARDRARAFTLDHALDRARVRTDTLDLDLDLDCPPDHDHVLDLYVILSLLQARLNGRLPAYEGILLVKERVQESKT